MGGCRTRHADEADHRLRPRRGGGLQRGAAGQGERGEAAAHDAAARRHPRSTVVPANIDLYDRLRSASQGGDRARSSRATESGGWGAVRTRMRDWSRVAGRRARAIAGIPEPQRVQLPQPATTTADPQRRRTASSDLRTGSDGRPAQADGAGCACPAGSGVRPASRQRAGPGRARGDVAGEQANRPVRKRPARLHRAPRADQRPGPARCGCSGLLWRQRRPSTRAPGAATNRAGRDLRGFDWDCGCQKDGARHATC
jgi:hypothetical protein